MKIVASILLVISALLSLKHGWDAFQPATEEQLKMMSNIEPTPKGVIRYKMSNF